MTRLRTQAKKAVKAASRQLVVITQNGRACAMFIGVARYNEKGSKLEAPERYLHADWQFAFLTHSAAWAKFARSTYSVR